MLEKQDVFSDTVGSIDNYDVDEAIRVILTTAKQLCDETASAIHRIRMNWVGGLIERYRINPGRPMVHLSDILDSTQIGVSGDARQILLEPWQSLGEIPGSFRSAGLFRGIRELVHGKPKRLARLGTWEFFGSLTGFKADDLEPFVTRLRISGGRYMRLIENPRLPFDLATNSGTRLIGYQGDANSRNSAFTNKDPLLHEDYAACVRGVVGNISITRTVTDEGGFGEWAHLRTNVGRLITAITRVAGLDNSTDQKLANNPLPLWLHLCDDFLIAACISALWDAEGSINFRDLKISQAVALDEGEEWRLPEWPANTPLRRLPNGQVKVMESPPLLLVSAALLLRRLGIVSRILPLKASMTSTGPTSYWQLRIHHDQSIERFRQQIKLLSLSKAMNLAKGA